jgi:hypothetical protein
VTTDAVLKFVDAAGNPVKASAAAVRGLQSIRKCTKKNNPPDETDQERPGDSLDNVTTMLFIQNECLHEIQRHKIP